MKNGKLVFYLLFLILFPGLINAQGEKEKSALNIDIPYQKFTLSNGLTLIVHEDSKAPIAAVNIWYHVGSKNEKSGKTGFAHLFEHLMFNGSENFDDDYFQALERVGATDLNGTTNNDRTNYFQNVPVAALDLALWMESDRMGHLIGAITQAKLDEQRGVVQNEKRQYENEPYGRTDELITEASYPKGHPYSWTVIGSMEDLNAASLEDVREWFKTYYGPSNAVIAVSGDIKAEEVKAKVEKYFGDIPPGPPIAKHQTWVAKRTGVQRQVLQDRVPQAKLYKVWNIPQWGTETADQLDLISDILGSGKTSRLYKRLVYQDQIATNVSVYTDLREIAGQFYIEATAKPGDDLKKIEQAIDEELAAFLKNGPTEKELERVKTQYFANFLKGIERIGGFGGKSDILARNMVYAGTPDYYKTTLKHVQGVTASSIKKAANDWLSDGVYILEVYPFPEFTPLASGADRTKLPVMGENPAPKFPDVQKAELSNGLKIVLAERKSIPVVNMSLLVDAGYASDQFAKAGTASLAMDMLDEGTKKLDALQISEELALLGAGLWTGADLDYSRVSLSALKANIDKSLDIFADVVLNPSFPQEDFKRLQQQKLAQIQREKSTPVQMALRTFPQLLYGEGHAYGNPLTGSGTEDNVAKMTREDLMNFHKTWFKPNHSTLIVVGDITMPELKSKLEKLFASWKRGDIPQKNLSEVKQQPASKIYLIDRPGSLQSIIFAGHVVPPMDMKNETAINSMNNILGGSFTSRINMNLREDKHWSYGASSFIWNAKGQRPFIVYTSVQTDKTKESVFEIKKELTQILADKPVSQDEVDKVQKSQILEMPGSWETNNAVLNSIAQMVEYNLPEDYFDKLPSEIKDLNTGKLTDAAKEVLHPENVVWVVVGDRAKVEAGLKELDFGEVQLITVDGKAI